MIFVFYNPWCRVFSYIGGEKQYPVIDYGVRFRMCTKKLKLNEN